MIQFGAFDALVPNGVISLAHQEHCFGLRFLPFDPRDSHKQMILESQDFPWQTLRIGPIINDTFYTLTWSVGQHTITLHWTRLDDHCIYGTLLTDADVEIIAELYVPWRFRLTDRWANITVQDGNTIAGEVVSPFPLAPQPAVRVLFAETPIAWANYNDRPAQWQHLMTQGQLTQPELGTIWKDMGLWWHGAAQFKGQCHFLFEVGDPQNFITPPDLAERQRRFADAAKQVQGAEANVALPLQTSGVLGSTGAFVRDLLSFNTVYQVDKRRRYIITDRPWAREEDDWGIIFNWDTFLSSLAAAWFDPALSQENALTVLETQLPDGRIPLHSRRLVGSPAEPPILAGRSQHIVQGFAIWEAYLHHLNRDWLAQCYPALVKAHSWWFTDRGDGQAWRDGRGRGLLSFGYDPEREMGIIGSHYQPYVAQAQYAYFETYDDSPQWTTGAYFKSIRGQRHLTEHDVKDEARYEAQTHTATMYTLERNCLYTLECECLAKIARELGDTEAAQAYEDEYRIMCDRINATMWDETAGCYFNVRYDGTRSPCYSPDCFLPLLAGIADERQATALVAILCDPAKFWGDYLIPSIARDDPAFADQEYWRGQIWPPLTYWTYRGLKRYGFFDVATAYADKVRTMSQREWDTNGFGPENFNANTGHCSGSPHYNWSTLLGIIALEEYVTITPTHVTFGSARSDAETELHNIPLGPDRYAMQVHDGITIVERNNVEIARGEGALVIQRE